MANPHKIRGCGLLRNVFLLYNGKMLTNVLTGVSIGLKIEAGGGVGTI